ncbi:hypothetical protein SAY87_012411 [Trapa incisa]|uniref:Uncharacterized protein n=2 Tax=Trapa TaxID=22665 RepID=A0AAN7MLG9_TRANT|nr:hypothetical protein SAY87_012411 [Trapa incisa]KAK4797063.1 hypothetical protein SAY86_029389 [Trapa natans]
MASSIAPEDWAITDYIELHEVLGGIELGVLETSHDILMSLMEDSQGDDQELDRLNDFIQSLEAEIHRGTADGPSLVSETVYGPTYDGEDLSDDFSWMDMELVPSSLVQGMEGLDEEMNCAAEIEHVDVHLTEEAKYSRLWHELCDEMME